MNKNNDSEPISNQAFVTGSNKMGCDGCDEKMLFKMRDNYHEFTLGMTTILECLRIAETEGLVPKLPSEWWISTELFYGMTRIVQEE